MMKTKFYFLTLTCFFFCTGFSQKIMLDEGIRAGELQLFPVLGNENSYHYLLDRAKLARNKDDSPSFSFIRYVYENENSRREVISGGLVHFLVELRMDANLVKEAERELKRINSSGSIIGPILYERGTVTLITAFNDQNGDLVEKVLGTGSAPLLEGQKAAFSIQLTHLGANLLMESLSMPTSQLSIKFENEVLGFRTPKQVKIEAKFEELYKNQVFEAAAVTPVYAAELRTAFEDLRLSRAIKATLVNPDDDLQSAYETAYNQLTALIFERTSNELKNHTHAHKGRKSMLDRMTEQLDKARKEAIELRNRRTVMFKELQELGYDPEIMRKSFPEIYGAEKDRPKGPDKQEKNVPDDLPDLAIGASYRLKQVKQVGTYSINLNKYVADKKVFPFSHNLGKIECNTCILETRIDDPLLKKRSVHFYLDQVNANDLKDFVNFIDVSITKKHGNGKQSFEDMQIQQEDFESQGNSFSLAYGREAEDKDSDLWRTYDAKVVWGYFGGHKETIELKKSKESSLILTAPYRKQDINVILDAGGLKKEGIIAIDLNLYYTVGNKELNQNHSILLHKEALDISPTIVVPQGGVSFEYECIFTSAKTGSTFPGGRKKSNSSVLLLTPNSIK